MTRTQVDRLGDRIRRGAASPDDLRLLADYRDSFRQAYQYAAQRLRERGIEVTGRTKSNISIERKLTRQPSLRLSQMQDIEGCRIVVPDNSSQEAHVIDVGALFDRVDVLDRRERPSHGYRAVHLIVGVGAKVVEVQIRTTLQDLWAQLCERLAEDVGDPEVKYGGGPDDVRKLLTTASDRIDIAERLERGMAALDADLARDPTLLSGDARERVRIVRDQLESAKADVMRILAEFVGTHVTINGDPDKP